jgi:branched-chain amino acid transport system permease protein
MTTGETTIANPAVVRSTSAWHLLLAAVLAVLLIGLPHAGKASGLESFTGLATQVLIYGIAAMSLNLILGYGGMISFGHAAFFGVGGYTAGILYFHFADQSDFLGFIPGTDSLMIVLPAAMLAGGLMAAIIGSFSLRTGGVQFIMITLAFAQMLYFLFVSLTTYGGDDGLIMRRRETLPFIDTRDTATFYYLCLAAAAAWLVLTACIVRSRFGFVLNGMRQNEQRMAAMGYAPYPYKLVAFVIAGMGAGLAGALMANYLRFASPDMLHWTKSGELMMMVILGGSGTLFGPLLGAAALVVLESFLTAWTENWQLPLGIILLAIVLFSQGGLVALLRRFSGGRS